MPPVAGKSKSRAGKFKVHKAARCVKALPLKFFNVKTSERFVFKRRDRRCLLLSPKSSLVPVFIHYSDIFPDQVQATLDKCKEIIMACPKVFVVKPSVIQCAERPHADNIVFDGSGNSIPNHFWERQGTLLRTLDIVQFKVSALNRKKDLLPVERDLWSVVQPFLIRIHKFADDLGLSAVVLDNLESAEALQGVILNSVGPWSLKVSSIQASTPSVGDREHMLIYSPKTGVFIRKFTNSTAMPIVTLPCRLQNGMPLFPSSRRILDYLESIDSRIENRCTAENLRQVRMNVHAIVEEPGLVVDLDTTSSTENIGSVSLCAADSSSV